ncbi:hypothetical protein KR026_001338 [Drosophila bipectinata]|nr:hypothetical protein KR026_001338 [Drosophila bipectinata]
MALVKKICTDKKNNIPWILWLSPDEVPDPCMPQVVAFDFLVNIGGRLCRWMNLYERIAQEFAGRILFGVRDISNIQEFNSNLNPKDFRSFRLHFPPLIFAKDREKRVYEMHKLFTYKNMKDFCDQLLQDKLFQAVVLGETVEEDSPARNFFDLQDEWSEDIFVVFYEPGTECWTIQERILRKLVRLLDKGDLMPVVVDTTKSFIGVGFHRWLNMVKCHGTSIIFRPEGDGWDINIQSRLETTRLYLQYIAQNRRVELKNFDANGEPRGPEESLEFIRYIFMAN